MKDVEAYYDNDYTILVDSEEEDQIYEVRDGKPLYRTDHQVATLLSKIPLPRNAALLDYGCAKSSAVKALLKKRADIAAHLFDVSERYIPFWEKFVPPGNWSTYHTKPEWGASFDVITSFFSMEHIVHPAETLRDIAGLLKPDGIFYCIVPNVLTNIADFIVVDHVNHFTKSSLAYLLESAGLKPIEIDDTSHRGAFVVIATKPGVESPAPQQVTAQKDITHTMGELNRIATFWKVAGTNTRNFEATLGESEEVAIYGAGFYGAFLSACLDSPGRVACFLDQNPHLQGKLFNGNPILPPADLPDKIHTLLVGLNPAYANQIIADKSTLQQRSLRFFYL